jgi:acyl-CoA thioesterase-2
MASDPQERATLQRVLDVRPVGHAAATTTFRGAAATATSARMFGGHAMAQALLAAGRTVAADQLPASVHTVLLRPGDAAVDCDLEVEVVRDGRAFASRRVIVSQAGRTLALVTTQWHVGESCSMSFEGDVRLAPRPQAQGLPYPAPGVATDAFDLRWADEAGGRVLWFRPRVELGEARDTAAALLVYVSDLWLADTALRRVGRRFDDQSARASTLEHSVWLHGPACLAGWSALRSSAAAARHGRAVVTADVLTESGSAMATVVQSVSLRDRPASSSNSRPSTRSAP